MKQVDPTDNPTLQDLLSMSANLRIKLNHAVSVSIGAWHYNSGTSNQNRADFSIFVSEVDFYERFYSWSECFSKYCILMIDGLPEKEIIDG